MLILKYKFIANKKSFARLYHKNDTQKHNSKTIKKLKLIKKQSNSFELDCSSKDKVFFLH